MKSKSLFPHKGRGYLELDRRLVLLFSIAARRHGVKQDELFAAMLLDHFEDEKALYGSDYVAVEKALRTGELARKNAKNKLAHIAAPIEADNLTPDGVEVPKEIRDEWSEFLKGQNVS